MALIIADRVKETATTTGTGTFTLGGAVTGFRTFNAGIGTGNTTYYCIFLDGTNEFEVGLGTYTAPDQLARDTVLASSNSGSKVNFSQGIKSVFCTQPSSKAAYLDASGNLSITTSNITEGTNLYYTDARFDTRLASKDTADLSEGTNLYYTDARARAAISVSGNAIAYNSSTGVITANFEESPTFTGNVVVSGNLTVTGTTTWLDSTNTQISDKNIVLNYASGDSSANADGAGITIQDAVDASTDATFTWNATDDNFEISHGLDFGDNSKARFGAGNDLEIYHNGSDSYITNDAGIMYIRQNLDDGDILLQSDNGSGGVTTYIQLDGSAQLTNFAQNTKHNDSVKATFGASQDLEIYHDGSHSYVKDNGTGNLTLAGTNLYLTTTNGQILFKGLTDAETALYYDNSEKLATTSSGIDVTGSVTADDYRTDGSNPFYLTSAADWRFRTTGGSERVRLTSDGRLGIGTSSPNRPVTVHATSQTFGSTQSVLQLGDDTAMAAGVGGGVTFTGKAATGQSDSNTAFGGIHAIKENATSGNTSSSMIFSTRTSGSNPAERLRINNSGNVGIGTSSPAYSLDVRAASNVLLKLASTSASNNARMVFAPNNAIKWNMGVNIADNAFTWFDQDTSTSPVRFEVGAANNTLVVDSNSRVGIGTDSPSEKLHIVDTSNPASTTGSVIIEGQRDGTANLMELRARDASASSSALPSGQGGIVRFTGFDGTDFEEMAFIGYQAEATVADGDAPSRLIFGTTSDGAGAASEKMRITSAGNVGIGTTSPADKLHVDGRVRTSTSGIALSDTNAVIYRNSNDLELITYGGFDINLMPSNNVGIGTTSPSLPLHLNGGTNNQIALFESTDATVKLGFKDNSTTNNYSVTIGAVGDEMILSSGSGGNECIRIDSSGNFLVGTTGVPNGTSVYGAAIVDGGGSGLKQFRAASSTTTAVSVARWYNPNGNVGSIQTSGSSTSYTTSSDARLKDITGSARGLEVINELNPVAYDWKADGKSDEGLIAQEVMELVPNAVSGSEEDMYQMDYSKLVVHLVKGMQELTAKVESLEAQLANK